MRLFNDDKYYLKITQDFGNDLIIDGKSYYSKFGLKGHNGLDCVIVDKKGWRLEYSKIPLISPFSGEIIDCDNKSLGTYGNYIVIKTKYNFCFLVAHLSSLVAFNKGSIQQGDIIGYMGNTGASMGAHFHFAYYEITNNNIILNTDNGYNGKLDPFFLFQRF